MSGESASGKLFKQFEQFVNDKYYSKKDSASGKKARTKLAILDDSAILQMWHAICGIFFSDAQKDAFSVPLRLEFNSDISFTYKLRREIMNNKFEYNPYFDSMKGTQLHIDIDHEPTIIAIGFYGSSVYGEWLNHWIAASNPSELSKLKKINFPKVSNEVKDFPKLYFGLNSLTALIAHEITVVPTELFFEFYKHEKNETGLLVHYIKDQDENSELLRIQVDNEFCDTLKIIREQDGKQNEELSEFYVFEKNQTNIIENKEEKIPEINISYSTEFSKLTLGNLTSLLTNNDSISNFEKCLKSFIEIKAKPKPEGANYIWDIAEMLEKDCGGFLEKEETAFKNDEENFKKLMEDAINDLKSLDPLATYFYHSFVRPNKNLRDNIKAITSALKIKSSVKDQEDTINFIKTIQFVNALSIALNVEESHFYFPPSPKNSKLGDSPTIFIVFFGPYDSNVLKTINNHYGEFIEIYNKKYLQTKVLDSIIEIDQTLVGKRVEKDERIRDENKKKRLAEFSTIKCNEFFNNMRLDYFDDNIMLMKTLSDKIPILFCDHILISCLFAKEFLSETKVEHSNIQYSFLISNKMVNEFIQRKYCLKNKNSYTLFYNLSTKKDAGEWPTVNGSDIFKNKGNLYKAIGLLKGHYTLLNKENRIIGILPDDTEEKSIKLYNILNLDFSTFQQENNQINKTEILKKITGEIDGVCGITVSQDGIIIIYKGQVILLYNAMTKEWEKPIEIETWDKVSKFIASDMTKYTDDKRIINYTNKEIKKIQNSMMKISDSHSFGAIFIIDPLNEAQKYTSKSFLIDEFADRQIQTITEDDLFDVAIMDGATIAYAPTMKDGISLKVRGRISLHPKVSAGRQEDFDILNIDPNELLWTQEGKRYSLGLRHQNALGMAFCTSALIFVVSSTGDVTVFYRSKMKDKVMGYSSLVELPESFE